MKITHISAGEVSISEVEDLVIGKQVSVISEGIQPTYGMTADDMGFETFIMIVKWSRKTE